MGQIFATFGRILNRIGLFWGKFERIV